MKEVYHWEWALKFQKHTVPNGLPFLRLKKYDLSCFCYHGFVLSSWTLNLCRSPIKLFSSCGALVTVICYSDRKVANIIHTVNLSFVFFLLSIEA